MSILNNLPDFSNNFMDLMHYWQQRGMIGIMFDAGVEFFKTGMNACSGYTSPESQELQQIVHKAFETANHLVK